MSTAASNSIIVRFLDIVVLEAIQAVEIKAFAERFDSKPYHIICHFLFVIFDQWNFLRNKNVFSICQF
jgi:hypothetical protein